MYISSVSIENFRAFKEKTVFHFNPGVTVLIGENDCGKSTVIDAIRYVLGTTDQSWQRVELSDYYQENTEELSEVIKQVYSSDGYLAAIKRGVRPVGRIKRLAEFSKEIFLRGE